MHGDGTISVQVATTAKIVNVCPQKWLFFSPIKVGFLS